MSDTTSAPQAATETPVTQVTPATQVVETPATPREEIQKKYDALYGAPTEQPKPTQVTPAPAPQPQPTAPDYSAQMAAMAEEIKALRAAQPKPEPVAKPTEADWLALLAAGDKDAGEKAMAEKIKSLIAAEIQGNAVTQATERINAERQINEFVNDVRTKNSDVLVMEQSITLGAQARIQAAANAGKIQTPSDYVAVYKDAVNAEIENARNLILSIRGQGKLEGQTRVSEVIASSTLQPNSVTQARETAAPQGEQIEDPSSYIARRIAEKAQKQGM